jgi:hypothetical protein
VGKLFRSALAAAAVTLTALMAAVPASAAPAPIAEPLTVITTGPSANAVSPQSVATGLNLPWAWVHFQPTAVSDHLTINQGDAISAVCKVEALSGGTWVTWDLVYDRTLNFAGYTAASYLTNPTSLWCWDAGNHVIASQTMWVHLATHVSWEHQVINPGDEIAPICSLLGSEGVPTWDLIIDYNNSPYPTLAGFGDDSAIPAAIPPRC